MKYTLVFRSGGENKLIKDPIDNTKAILEINTDEIKQPSDLSSILNKKLIKIKEFEVDLNSWNNLEISSIDSEAKDLVLYTFFSDHKYIPYSLKQDAEKDIPDWNISEPKNEDIEAIIYAYEHTKKLQETPPNIMTPEAFVENATKFLSNIPDVIIKEIKGEELKTQNLNLIMAVGKASINPPRLLIAEYKVNEKPFKALIGKGVCYDSGGLNIKTGPYMSTMKFDMSGAAVSLGVLYSLAKNRSNQNLVVAMPLVENSVSNNAYRPDDVIISRSGKSIEIDNTDAEGRLVLADAISYTLEEYKPEEIITIATLTGAIGYALGNKFGGAWTTSCDQWQKLKAANKKAGEWLWRMPLDDYYLKALKRTRVADIKNSARTGAGGASRAACFLKEFVSDTPFVHLDIANIAHCETTNAAKSPLLKTLYYYLKK